MKGLVGMVRTVSKKGGCSKNGNGSSILLPKVIMNIRLNYPCANTYKVNTIDVTILTQFQSIFLLNESN